MTNDDDIEYPDDWEHDLTKLPPEEGGPDPELPPPPTPEAHAPLYGGGTGENHETYLRGINPVPLFDTCLSFDEPTHTYSYEKCDGYFERRRKVNSSTTSVLKAFFEEFDADKTLAGMRQRGRMRNPADEYYNMTDKQIKDMWQRTNNRSRDIGTEMHNCIERYLNNARRPNDPWERTRQFALFRRWHAKNMIAAREPPFRTELCMFNERAEMAGMADLVTQPLEWREDPKRSHWVNLKDWKCTNKCNWEFAPFVEIEGELARWFPDPNRIFAVDTHQQVKTDPKKGKTFRAKQAKGIFSCLVDCTLAMYTVQLNIYRFMIELGTKLRVQSMEIVAFHWTNDEPLVFVVPDLQPLVARVFQERTVAMQLRYRIQADHLRDADPEDEQVVVLRDRLHSLAFAPTEQWPN